MIDLRQRARTQFEARSSRYQDGFAQKVYLRPTSRGLLRRLPRQADLRVLDVGCGTGQLLRDIRQHRPDAWLYGLDLCAGMLRQARHILGTGVGLVHADSHRLPFGVGSFDVVICTHSFHHYPDQAAVLREMFRVLRPGGRVMVLDGDRDNPWGWLLYDVFVVWAEGPVRHRSARDMERLCRAAGFCRVQQYRSVPWSPVLLTIGVKEGG